jgi:hypothetical protein
MAKNKPTYTIRLGTIKAALWENETQNGTRFNVTIQRLYMVDGEWAASDSFGRDDLLLVAKVADLAHSWIFERSRKEAKEEPEDAGEPPIV